MANEETCKICNAEFYKGVLVDGKCPICLAAYPDCNSQQEAMLKHGKRDEKHLHLTEDRVKNLIYEILAEANIQRKKCERCGAMFFPRSPAQLVCQNCKDKDLKNKQ